MTSCSDAGSRLTGSRRSTDDTQAFCYPAVQVADENRYVPVDPQTLGRLRVLRIGDVELHLDGHRIVVRGKSVCLPHKEFVILHQLMDNAGRVVTRRALLDNARDPARADGRRNYVEVHIRRLRAKIESDVRRPTRIRTVRGLGYVFDLPQDDGPPDHT